jgi:histone-lysine N-methyltransferase SETMAR
VLLCLLNILQQFGLEGNTFPEQILMCDKIWVHYFTADSKQSSMEQCHKGSPSPKKLKTHLSDGKIMASVVWNSEGVIHIDFLPHGVTINAQYYSNFHCNDVHQAIQKKRHGKLSTITPLHDDPCPHMAHLTKVALATMGRKIMNHPPYSPDLVPSDFNLFGPI